jgi:hypothetical protein
MRAPTTTLFIINVLIVNTEMGPHYLGQMQRPGRSARITSRELLTRGN